MKKYFVVETDEICEFGDALHLVFFKEIKGGKVTVEKDVEFSEDTMDWMIEMGFVEEREVEENDLIDFSDEQPCEALAALEEDFEALEQRIDKLEELANKQDEALRKLIANQEELIKAVQDLSKKQTASPKKK